MMSLVMGLLKASIFLGILGLGLRATITEATWLFRNPRFLVAAFISMSVVMPLAAIVIGRGFHLAPVIQLTLVTFAVSPVVHLFVGKTLKAGGRDDFVMSLFVLSTVASVILIPLTAIVLEQLLGTSTRVAPSAIATLVGTSVLLPLALGMLLRRIAPALSARTAGPIAKIATLLLLAAFIPLFIKVFRPMGSLLGDGTLIAIAVFSLVGMVVGHFAGGGDEADRTVLAIADVTRHPAIALAVARLAEPEEPRIGAAILLLVIVNAVLSAVYAATRKRAPAPA